MDPSELVVSSGLVDPLFLDGICCSARCYDARRRSRLGTLGVADRAEHALDTGIFRVAPLACRNGDTVAFVGVRRGLHSCALAA